MSEHGTPNPAPVVCTLDPSQRQSRHVEWTDLAGVATSMERTERGVVGLFDVSLADGVEELAERECECCGSWMAITTTRIDDAIRLEISTTNPDGVDFIATMVGLAS